MYSSNVRDTNLAPVGAAALLILVSAERTKSALPESPWYQAARSAVPRIEIFFGYTFGHSETVFSSPVLEPMRPRGLTQREDAVFRRALMNSVRVIATGRLLAK